LNERPAAGLEEIARLLDEIRRDPDWRAEVAAAAAPVIRAVTVEPPRPSVAAVQVELADTVKTLLSAIEQADEPIAVGIGTPVVGEAMAAFRRRVHAEIRLSQDRQTAVNKVLVAALRRLAEQVATTQGPIWATIDGLAAEVAELRSRVNALEGELGRIEALELEPLGHVRVAVAELVERVKALEGGR